MFTARDAMWVVAIWQYFKIRGPLCADKLQMQDDTVDFKQFLITG